MKGSPVRVRASALMFPARAGQGGNAGGNAVAALPGSARVHLPPVEAVAAAAALCDHEVDDLGAVGEREAGEVVRVVVDVRERGACSHRPGVGVHVDAPVVGTEQYVVLHGGGLVRVLEGGVQDGAHGRFQLADT